MLKKLTANQAHFIALLADAARKARDGLIGHVPEEDLGGLKPARGEHNPTSDLGPDALSPDALQAASLHEAVNTLSQEARRELYALMRVGQGHLSAKTWNRGIADADALGDDAVSGAILDDSDLHDHVKKGLFEVGLSST